MLDFFTACRTVAAEDRSNDLLFSHDPTRPTRLLSDADNVTETLPQIGVFPLIEIPTGDENKQLGSGKVQAYIPAWVQKSWGKLTTYAGGGFSYNPGLGQKNWGFAGWQAQYDFSEVVTLGGEVFYQTANSQDSESSGGFNFGGFINLNENNHILFSLSHSISGAAAITGYIGYQLTI